MYVYDMNQKILTKKVISKISVDSTGIAPQTTVLN